MVLQINFLPAQLQYTAIYGCSLQLKAKKKNLFFYSPSINILFRCFFFFFFLISLSSTRQFRSLSLNSHLSLNSLSILTSLSQLSLPPAHLESQSSSHPRQPTSKLNSHRPFPLTHATTNLARLPSFDPSLLLTQLADLSPKP